MMPFLVSFWDSTIQIWDNFKVWMGEFFDSISSVWNTFRPWDIVDVILVAYLVYLGIKLVRETRAGQLVKGLILLGAFYVLASVLQLSTLEFIIQKVFDIGIVAVIVIFQPDLRRALEKFGRTRMTDFGVFGGKDTSANAVWIKAIDATCMAVQEFSKSATGALIVFERKTRLGEQLSTGVMVNATPSAELFGNIFYPNTPLHDGAVIIRDGMILAAACFLPKPQKEELISNNLGSRHRAAIGISEVSDAITVVVSEETGTISVTSDGEMIRGFTSETLNKYLCERLLVETDPNDEKKSGKRRGKKRKTEQSEKEKSAETTQDAVE